MIIKWKKKPLVVEAVQFDGINISEIEKFVGSDNVTTVLGVVYGVKTLDDNVMISKGDYIVRDHKGDIRVYPGSKFHEIHEKQLVWDENI